MNVRDDKGIRGGGRGLLSRAESVDELKGAKYAPVAGAAGG